MYYYGRIFLHVPWGILAAFPLSWGLVEPVMLWPGIAASAVSAALMVIYELASEWHHKDDAAVDILGIVWGYLIGMIGCFIAAVIIL